MIKIHDGIQFIFYRSFFCPARYITFTQQYMYVLWEEVGHHFLGDSFGSDVPHPQSSTLGVGTEDKGKEDTQYIFNWNALEKNLHGNLLYTVCTSSMMYHSLAKERPFPPPFVSCSGSKFTWMCAQPGVSFAWLLECNHGSLRSTASNPMYIWGKKLCVILHWRLLHVQGSFA